MRYIEGKASVSFIRKVSLTFGTRVCLLLLGLVTSIVVARTIGPENKGVFSLAMLAAAVVFNSTNLGIGTGSGYFLGRRKLSLDVIAGHWLSLSLLIGTSLMCVSVLLAPYLVPRLLPSVPVRLVVIALVSVPFMILVYNFQTLFKANNDFRNFNILDLMQPSVFLVLFTAVVVAYGLPGRRLSGAVLVFLISNAAAGTAAVALIWRVTRLRFRWSGKFVRSAVRFGVQGYLANFLSFLNLRFDLLLVNLLLLDPVYVGYYSISVMVAEKIWYVPDALAVVLHPRVAHGREEDANRDTAVVSRQTLLIVVLGCLAVLLLGRFMVELFYSERFLPAVIPLYCLLPGIISSSLARVISSDLLARGYPRVPMWAGLISLLTNIGLNVVLIPRLGVSGAALATTASYTLNALVMVSAFVRITGVLPADILFPRRDDFRLLISSLCRLLHRAGDGGSRGSNR